MTVAVRFKPIVRINEYEVGPFEGALDARKPLFSGLPDDWHYVAGEDGAVKDIGSFQCSNIPLPR